MLNPAFPHRAFYNEDGDIIVPPRESEPEESAEPLIDDRKKLKKFVVEKEPTERPSTSANPSLTATEEIVGWIITEDSPAELHALEPITAKRAPVSINVREHIVQLRTVTRQAVREGARQYTVSIASGVPILRHAREDIAWLSKILWNFLSQPVWVPTRKREIKQYSRGTLFLLDILRFGGTFTMIFLGLFLALNYDSFWQITKSRVETVLHSPIVDTPDTSPDRAVIDALKATALQSAEGRERGDLISYLPTVGPPDNRLLVPRLNLNVPIVTPPVESLLRQDWVQVETDIQDSLQYGVVHYPGTARPGQAGNFFVTGHSSYYPWAPGHYKTIFARLHDLKPGDEYWVYYKGDKHRYIITQKKEVSPSDVTVLDQPADQRIATLMTCTPVGTTLRRLIVVAQEVDPQSGTPLKIGERAEKSVAPRPQLEALPI